MDMTAPDWYRRAAGPAGLRPPPPGSTSLSAPSNQGLPRPPAGKAVQLGAKAALPALPDAAAPRTAVAKHSALVPLPAAPAGQALALPPSSGNPGNAKDSLAVALPSQSPQPPAKSAPVGPAALVDAAPARGTLMEEKSFIIPGLQSREYTDEELLEAFEMIDLDGHGKLGPADLHRALGLSGEGDAPDAEISEMIRLADPSGTGFVSFEEFVKAFKDPPLLFRNFDVQRRELNVEAPPQVRLAALPEVSPQPQPPKDDRISAVAALLGQEPASPQLIKHLYQRFVELDEEDEGLVSYEAFCRVFRKPQSAPMRAAFDAFDLDMTSELDLQTFIVGLSMFTESRAEDKLRFAFMMYDEDQSGTLARPTLGHMLRAIAPHLPAQDREAHLSRLFATQNIHPNAGVALEDLTDYVMEHAQHQLLPPSPASSASGVKSGPRPEP